MVEAEPAFRPVRPRDGFPALEDLGLIGDGATAALVGLDGGVVWLCVPGFDADPLFCGLLDRTGGGRFEVAPDGVVEARQRYLGDTGVLVTELRTATGLVRLTDALALRSGADLADDTPADRGELVRLVEVLDGTAEVRVDLEPHGGAIARAALGGLEIQAALLPGVRLHLRSSHPLNGGLRNRYTMRGGDRMELVLSWGRVHRHHRLDAGESLEQTAAAWRRWMTGFDYAGPQEALVRRAAVTLKLCDHWVNGSIVAAPTSSLPAPVGGVRNWDYRYTWIRDAAFAVFAMRRIGFGGEADAFLGWVLDAFEQSRRPRIMYTPAGGPVPDERVDPGLRGYRDSAPVRWGNGAADQRQHDVYGEILDCADQWSRAGGRVEPGLWDGLAGLADAAARTWRQPDQGIWEVRNEGHVHTYSAAMCQVALERAAGMAERLDLPGPAPRWRATADKIRRSILEDAWDDGAQTITEHLGDGGGVDASLLALPLRRVIPADHPRMVATTRAVTERLGAGGGLLHRYRHDESPDGIPGDEGAFLLCSFWLVDNLTGQGRLEEAAALYASLCDRASPLGLLPEQIDPATGEFAGNFPQAFSHIGVIASGVNLSRAMAGVS
ncbi:glycoside hydrolase family 15 protein [Dactylosporangium sp. CA-152071]|uniref:glycoside hydrolase family 15 protein n=1 Tax=Dactylosporangium sp. CA-152071 TaxID=3239933 RepID=UPI003D945B0E